MATTTLKLPTTSRSIKGTQAFTNAFAITPSDTVAYNEPIAVYVGKGGTVAGTNGWSVTFASAPEPQSVVTWTDATQTTPVPMGFGNGVQTVFPVTVNGQAFAPNTLLLYKNDWQGNQLQYPTPRTNLSLHSEDFSQTSYRSMSSVTTAAATSIAPGGATLKYTFSGGFFINSSSGEFTGYAALTFSSIIEIITSIDTYQAIYDETTSTNAAQIQLVPSTGVVTATIGSPSFTVENMGSGPNGGTLFRLSISVSGLNTAHAYHGFWSQNSASSLVLHTEQTETGTVSTSFIQTTTSPVTVTDYTLNSNSVSFTPAAGQLLPQRVKQVMATGTTATNLVGLY